MSQNSSIEWTGRTWQVTAGCSRHSPGCQNCYAEKMAGRLAAMAAKDLLEGRNPGKKRVYLNVVKPDDDGFGPNSGWNHQLVTQPENLGEPLTWRKPQTVFVNSMSDLFHEKVPFDFIDQVFGVMASQPRHTFQVLTKRADRMAQYFADRSLADVYTNCLQLEDAERVFTRAPLDPLRAVLRLQDSFEKEGQLMSRPLPKCWPLPNVWLGCSVENQEWAENRIPHLLKCPAAVRFLSCEPLLGPIDFNALGDGPWGYNALTGLRENAYGDVVDRQHGPHVDWVIVGGESGSGSRPMSIEWVKDIVRQCKRAKVAVFVKQLGVKPTNKNGQPYLNVKDSKGGNPVEWPDELRVRQFPNREVTHAA